MSFKKQVISATPWGSRENKEAKIFDSRALILDDRSGSRYEGGGANKV